MLCFRLLNEDEPATPLAAAIQALHVGQAADNIYVVDPASFRQVPNSPFAYWVSDNMRNLFRFQPAFASEGREAWMGLSSGDNFQWIRLSWEVPTELHGRSPLDAASGRGWVPLAKGGAYSPYYADLHLVVNWSGDGKAINDWKHAQFLMGRITENNSKCWNRTKYFRPGLTWPNRTTSGISMRVLPTGVIFGSKGPAAFTQSDDCNELLELLSVCQSAPFQALVSLQLAAADAAARSYEVGVIQRTVVPSARDPHLAHLARLAWTTKRCPDTANLTSLAFYGPALARGHFNLAAGIAARDELLTETASTLADVQGKIDDIVCLLYGIGDEDHRAINLMLAGAATGEVNESTSRFSENEENEDGDGSVAAGAPALVSELLDYNLGCIFGRWDIRYATGEQAAPELPDPFAPLPVCPPGQLQNAQGLPARPEDVPAAYPVRIPWDGILVDDPNHPLDLERRVREVIEIIWSGQEGGPTAEAIEHEACEILGVKSLRDYFRKPAGFFADHLKRYSKSRRQAPIYWPLSTASGSYTLWIYYHRLTDQTLYKCIQQFIDPRLADVEKELAHLRAVLDSGEGSTKTRRQLDAAEQLRTELKEMRAELEHWASRWKPNLNDGVVITACPLWKLFRLPKWRKDLEACWKELEAGDYDWAHLAHTLWPDRVRQKCKTDRSLAIAHGLEELCEVQAPKPKAKRAAKADAAAKEREAKKEELREQLTEALANIFLGQKLPIDITNAHTGEKVIPADRKITKTLLRKLAGLYDHVEMDHSPARDKIREIIGQFEHKFAELELSEQGELAMDAD